MEADFTCCPINLNSDKVVDLIVSSFAEKRQFNKLRRERVYNEIEF